jgi:hypothetical protein
MSPTAIALVVVAAVGFVVPRPAAAATHCVDGSATEARAAGGDAGPPTFTRSFFVRAMSIDASTDGLDQNNLPISIETICGLPRSLDKQAAQLAGGDGLAVITSRTSVWKDGARLPPDRKLVELQGADTVRLRGRLVVQRSWRANEDGDPTPTFTASRIVITD